MNALGRQLETLVRTHDAVARREADPVSFVHHYASPATQELVGLIASSLAFGNIVAAKRSIARVLEVLGEDPVAGASIGRRRLSARLRGFVHRVYRGPHLAALLAHASTLREQHGSLGAAFRKRLMEADAAGSASPLRDALAGFADSLRGPGADRGLRHLIPDPRAGSACKRLLLYLRWMVRPANGVDLGLWDIAPSRLIIPVDTHILRIARNLRLTDRKDASWRTAAEITAALRRFDAADPVKYDFALCHLGVSRSCPSKRDDAVCASCSLRPVCRHWTEPPSD